MGHLYYTCGTSRDVRGNCGHKHRTLAGALRCLHRDQRDCSGAGRGCYSDRNIVAVEDGERRLLDDWEHYQLMRMEDPNYAGECPE